MSSDKVRGVRRKNQIEPLDHVRSRDEEEKRFAGRSLLERDERVDGIAIDAAAKAVHRLGGYASTRRISICSSAGRSAASILAGRPEMEPRVCPSSFRKRKESLSSRKVRLCPDLHRPLASRERRRRTSSQSLAQRGIVGCADPLCLCLPMRAHDHLAWKSLRRLGPPQSVSLDGSTRDATGLIDLLERVDNRQCSNSRCRTAPRSQRDRSYRRRRAAELRRESGRRSLRREESSRPLATDSVRVRRAQSSGDRRRTGKSTAADRRRSREAARRRPIRRQVAP